MRKIRIKKRHIFPTNLVQWISLFAINGYFPVIKNPNLYQGRLKGLVCPSLNCYSCPLAYTSCPIGLMQHFAIIRAIPAYLLGWLGIIGATVGRAQCGWVCPFGLVQDLLYRIGKIKLPLPRGFVFVKYLILAGMIPLSMLTLDPVFCQFICPAGTLFAGIPQVLWIPDLRALVAHLFWIKISVLSIVVILSMMIKRPFCRALCPLGAFYSLFNRVSALKLQVDMDRCTECDLCYQVCPMDIKIYKDPNQIECIRCNRCVRICPEDAISVELFGKPLGKKQGIPLEVKVE